MYRNNMLFSVCILLYIQIWNVCSQNTILYLHNNSKCILIHSQKQYNLKTNTLKII